MKWILLALLCAAGTTVHAGEIKCDNCTEAGYEQAARSAGVGEHYVYDLVNAASRKYSVERTCESRNTCAVYVEPLGVEADFSNMVLELSAYHQMTQGTMRAHFEVYADGTAAHLTAFDVARPGGPREVLKDWAFNQKITDIRNALPAAGVSFQSILLAAASIFKNNIGPAQFDVIFADGSRITLTLEAVNGVVSAIEGSAKDPLGNIIPISPDHLGTLNFDYTREPNGPAQRRMESFIRIYGANVTGTTKWVCVRISDGAWNCKPF